MDTGSLYQLTLSGMAVSSLPLLSCGTLMNLPSCFVLSMASLLGTFQLHQYTCIEKWEIVKYDYTPQVRKVCLEGHLRENFFSSCVLLLLTS